MLKNTSNSLENIIVAFSRDADWFCDVRDVMSQLASSFARRAEMIELRFCKLYHGKKRVQSTLLD